MLSAAFDAGLKAVLFYKVSRADVFSAYSVRYYQGNTSLKYIPHKWIVLFELSDWLTRWWLASINIY